MLNKILFKIIIRTSHIFLDIIGLHKYYLKSVNSKVKKILATVSHSVDFSLRVFTIAILYCRINCTILRDSLKG